MSSIDERIVSIKFNNSQFEAGIKTTMTSLDGLKKSLNFSAGVKALGDLDAAGKGIGDIKINTAGFDAKVKATVDSANDLKKNLKFDDVKKGLNDLDAAGKKVNLKLDATAFQNGAKRVVDAANTIKNNLNFESVSRGFGNLKTSAQNMSFQSITTGVQGAIKSLGDLDLAAKRVDLSSIGSSVDNLSSKFSGMSVIGIGALAAIGAKAAIVGPQMAAQLFLDPAKSGLAEYETNLGSIQTIMANTQHEGTNLGDVNGALDELNEYSDKTIYNFGEMAKNIGTFTSAGVKLDDSTNAIKGIANLAALSGSNSEQASSAMYQLSQAMSAGKVGLQDWNSVVNAGMGGKVFQDALKETAENQGKNVDGLIKKHGSFRESLQEGWITTEVMTETLSKMTGDLTNEQLKAMGYNDEQILGIQKMAKTAGDAATKIKTFSQLTGTLTEITGSGWAQSWKLILGDFEQAKEMWTSVYGVIGDMVQGTADARNKMLGDWNKSGGRTEMIWAVSAAFKVLMGVMTPIKEAFREVFPPTTGKQLYEITQFIRLFIEALIPGEQAMGLIKNTFKLFFVILKMGLSIFTGAISVVAAFFKAFATGGESIGGSMKPLTDFLAKITTGLQNSTFIKDFFDGLAKGAVMLGTALGRVVPYIVHFVSALGQIAYDVSGFAMHYVSKFARMLGSGLVDGLVIAIQFIGRFVDIIGTATKAFVEGGFELVLTRVRERLESFGRMGDSIARMWDSASGAATRFWEKIKPLRDQIAKMFGDMGDNIKNAFGDVNFDDTLDMVNTGLLAGLVLLFRGMFKKLLGMGDGMKEGLMQHLDTTVESINGVLESLTGTLSAMQQNLQADTLMKIAIAIGILAISVVVLSMIDSGKLTKALIAIGVMVVILGKAMGMLDKISVGSGFLKIPFIAASMILLAIALALLTIPVVILSKLSWGELIKGLAGIAVMLFVLTKATESMSKNPANLIATGLGLIAVAIAVKILASAVADFAKLSWGDMIKGLVGVATMLTALALFNKMNKVNKGALASAAGLILLGIALKIIASAVSDLGMMDVASLAQGLIIITLVLAVLSKFSNTVGSGGNLVKAAVGILIIGVALKILASAFKDLAAMSWEDLAKGLTVTAIALKAISAAMARVPPNMLTSAIGFIAVAVAMKILASALKDMGGMSWEEIAKGLIVLAGALLIISVAVIAMSGALTGAAAILVVAAAIAVLAPALKTLGEMSWDQILHGMVALAGIFIIFGLAGLVLTPLVPILFALGLSLLMLGAGLLGIGVGTVLFSVGLLAIATAVTVAGPLLIAFIGSILALIPLAMTELGKGIVAFAGVIGAAMPVFIEAFVALLRGLLTAINIVFPELMTTLWIVIVGLVDLIVRAVPLFVDAAMKLVIGIVKGIADNIGLLIDQTVRLITEFIDGIARGLPQIIDSGVKMIVSFVQGLADGIRNNQEAMNTAGRDLAGAIIEGMVGGLWSGVQGVIDAAINIGKRAIDAIAGAIDSNSPSKESAKLGNYTSQGFALGITALTGTVAKAASGVGSTALSTLKKSVSGIGSTIEGDISMQPTIRPVLDLSAVKKDSGLINNMIRPPKLSVATSYAQASQLSVSARAKEDAETRSKGETAPSTGDTFVINQTNNSPKALSSAEIYRQTNNIMSRLKKKDTEVAV